MRYVVPRSLIALQVFALMCAPLPQASYVAIGLGRGEGLGLAVLLVLYALSDVVALTVIALAVRRLPLPQRVRSLVERVAQRAERSAHGRTLLPALFAVGFASLYSVAVLAGLSRVRLLPALAAGLAGDLVQFTTTVALGGALARLLPFPGADWVFVLTAPFLVAMVPVVRPAANGWRRRRDR